ncbi:MAG TPA: hypothetical protein DDX98_08600 [Bacteroidales bacterium]|jgi:hypothetical protein|nr:hypothetical protein [Bacteroidales bacterium]
MLFIKDNYYLVTTNDWFYGPDGSQYKAVWGRVEILKDETLGIKNERGHANWFVAVGRGESSRAIIAGCQIHYAVECPEPPISTHTKHWTEQGGKCSEYLAPNPVYIAEDIDDLKS